MHALVNSGRAQPQQQQQRHCTAFIIVERTVARREVQIVIVVNVMQTAGHGALRIVSTLRHLISAKN